jgi:NTE family protein
MADRVLDIVFEGGGARGLALNGGVAALHEAGYSFRRLVGTSAGAITATLVAAGYTGPELRSVSLEQNAVGASRMTEFIGTPGGFSDADLQASTLGTFLKAVDIPFVPEVIEQRAELSLLRGLMKLRGFAHVYSLVEHGGFFSADGFLAWLREHLDAGGRNMSELTFAQMFATTGRHLSLVVTDTNRSTFLVLNHVTAPDCPVLWGVRMSMSIPFFWPEVVWQPTWGTYQGGVVNNDGIVDGGVVSNFALRLLVADEDWIHAIMGGPPDPENQVLGLMLDQQQPVPNAPPPIGLASHLGTMSVNGKLTDRISRVVNAALSGNDLAEASHHPELVCHLPAAGYGVTEFHMGMQRIEALMNAAGAAVRGWLDRRGAPKSVGDARQQIAKR